MSIASNTKSATPSHNSSLRSDCMHPPTHILGSSVCPLRRVPNPLLPRTIRVSGGTASTHLHKSSEARCVLASSAKSSAPSHYSCLTSTGPRKLGVSIASLRSDYLHPPPQLLGSLVCQLRRAPNPLPPRTIRASGATASTHLHRSSEARCVHCVEYQIIHSPAGAQTMSHSLKAGVTHPSHATRASPATGLGNDISRETHMCKDH